MKWKGPLEQSGRDRETELWARKHTYAQPNTDKGYKSTTVLVNYIVLELNVFDVMQ